MNNEILELVYDKYHIPVLEISRIISASTTMDAGDLALCTLYDFASTYTTFDESYDYMPMLVVINRNRLFTELRKIRNNSKRESNYGEILFSENGVSSEDILINNETDRQLKSILGEGKMYDTFKGHSEGASPKNLSEENNLNISQVRILLNKSISMLRDNVDFMNGLMNNL